jgi:hypothetical protein
MPLLGNKNTAFAGITTPLGKDTMRTALEEMRDKKGNPIFISKNIGFVCERCLKNNKYDCPHMDMATPWKDEEKLNDHLPAMMGGDVATINRELKGIATDAVSIYFESEWVRRLHVNPERPLAEVIEDFPFIMMAVDPGGNQSHTAIISSIHMRDVMLVSRSVTTRRALAYLRSVLFGTRAQCTGTGAGA